MTQDLFARLGRRSVRGTAVASFAAPPTLGAQSWAVKISVLSEMGSVYADYAGGGSVEAAFRTLEQSTCRVQY